MKISGEQSQLDNEIIMEIIFHYCTDLLCQELDYMYRIPMNVSMHIIIAMCESQTAVFMCNCACVYVCVCTHSFCLSILTPGLPLLASNSALLCVCVCVCSVSSLDALCRAKTVVVRWFHLYTCL